MATQTPSSSTSEDTKKRKRDNSSCSEEDDKIITSSPTSSSMPQWKYEVFLSFYGKDTRKSFTDHLYVDLKRKGILVFRDDEALQRGEYISQALLKAIQESQYAIVIFSTNYAFSKWCLMELAEIVEWEEKKKLTILPIFYHVHPSDVRNQSGSFAEAFTVHEKDPKIDKKDTDMWKNALRKAGSIAGWHIHDGYESAIIKDINTHISRELNSRSSRHDYEKLVAIDSQADKMMELLDMESDGVRFVGIHGMGGIGKTLLAEIISDRVSSNCRFEGSSFISCVREKSTTARDLASMQKELLSTIMQEEIHVWDHHQGIRMIKKIMQNKKVFIVLDDVDIDEQLMALAGDRKWFGPGSRVIITCRDIHPLRTHEVNHIYKVEQLETAKALQLFSLSAFKKTHPIEDYKDLSMDFVNYAQGLPLALKVLGSFLFGRTIDAWKSEKDKLKAIPDPKIMDVLRISFDGLQESQKELFLDMVCLFRGQHRADDKFYEMLKSFGHYPKIDIDVLVQKSLISISEYGWLSMHDLLKEMGQEIVCHECPQEPGQRSRLFRFEDLYQVLKNDTGTDAIKGIVVDFCPEAKQRLNAEALSKMRKLKFFKFHHSQTIKWRGNPLKYMPTNELLFLEWSGYHLKSWPSSFQPKNLTVLRMSHSRIKQLWERSIVLENLKEFDMSYSENLIETPDFTGASNLEMINLKGCRNLCEVHPSIKVLKRLKELRLNECSSLEKLPDLSKLECLTSVWACKTAITQIPPVNLLPKSIRFFNLEGRKLTRDPTYDIGSLVEYQMEGKSSVEVVCIDFDSKGEKILDMAGGFVGKLCGDVMMISGWSSGFNIPEWVLYKSNGSSVTIDLDGSTNSEGCAFFIVCDYDNLFPLDEYTSISSLFKEQIDNFSQVTLDLWLGGVRCSFDYYLITPPLDDCLMKRIGFWVYIPAVLLFMLFSDIRRRFIHILFEMYSRGTHGLVEVKECGVHFVCPYDGANSEFFNSIASFGRSESSNSDFHRRYISKIRKKEEMIRVELHKLRFLNLYVLKIDFKDEKNFLH